MATDDDAIGFDEPATKTIGLCMIVKDEAAVIERCLDSVRPLVDYVLIEDTGSSDGTQEIIRAYLRRHGIPGEVIEETWRDFAHNRSHVMARLRERVSIDYALIMDADDRLVIEDGFDAAAFKAGLGADLYHVWIRLGSTRYHRPQICSNRREFRFRGVVHEYLESPPEGVSVETANGFYIAAGVEGARSNDPDKYRKDALALERALANETDAFLRTRYTFYLAQSWRDCGENEKSVAAYLDRAEQGGWPEEIFVSLYNAGKLQETLGKPIETVVATLLRASDVVPGRAEALHAASRACRVAGRNQLGYEIAQRGLDLAEPESGLFIEAWVYQYGLRDEYAINGYWSGHYEESLEACEYLLRADTLPAAERARVQQNADFAFGKQVTPLPGAAAGRGSPRVLVAILAMQKEAVLPFYLMCIEALDYPKDSIVLYVRADNSTDRTRDILNEWVARAGPQYAQVEFDDSDVPEQALAGVRQRSLRFALRTRCQFYFVADIDNFIRPHTLRELVAANQPIVGPLLRHTDESNPHSNYHAKAAANGNGLACEEDGWLLHRRVAGLCRVEMVHGTYLVRADAIRRLRYDDGSGRLAHVIFSDSARRNEVAQYLDTREVYGYLTLADDPAPALRLLGPSVALRLLQQRRQPGAWQIAFCCGLHGSGSTWLFNLVREIAFAAGWPFLSQFAPAETDFFPTLFHGQRLIVKAHAPPTDMRIFMAAASEPVTLSVRDPRDAVVSMMRRFGMSCQDALGQIAGDAENLVALAKLRSVQVWRYEDGFTSREATFDKVAELLGAHPSIEQRSAILEKLSPDGVRQTIDALDAADRLPGGVDIATHWHRNHVGDGRVGKFAEALSAEQQAEIMRRTRAFCEQFGYGGGAEETLASCPVCGGSETTKPRPDLEPHPYARCEKCGLFYQPRMRPKVYEAHHEQRGDLMSDADRRANLHLAGALYHNHLAGRFEGEPLFHLDIGSKYPFFGHCLQSVAKERGRTLVSHGIDGIAERREFGQQLGVLMAVGDFESDPRIWDMPDAMRQRIADGGFHVITLIHCLEHFYDPLHALRQIRRLIRDDGVVYIRSPDSAAPGIERDFTSGHYDIHPLIWCESAMREALSRIEDAFTIYENYELPGQHDYLLRPVVRQSTAKAARSGRRKKASASDAAPQPINILRPGAIGDVLASGAVTAQLAAQNPGASLRYYTKVPEMANMLIGIDQVLDSDEWERREPGRDLWLTGYPLREGYPEHPMHKHLVAYFCEEAGVALARPQLREPEPYPIGRQSWVTIHPKAGWSVYKEWPFDNWNAVVTRLREAYPDTAIAQIGGAGDPPIDGADCDLRGRTSISQAVWLVKNSALHLGVDSFTNHAAGAFGHPAIIVFGSTSPTGSGYDTAINLWAALGCSPCYREDPAISRQSRGPCINPPGQLYDQPRHACMAAITVDQVWGAITELLPAANRRRAGRR